MRKAAATAALAALLAMPPRGPAHAQSTCALDTAAAGVAHPHVLGLAPAASDLALAQGPAEYLMAAGTIRAHFRAPTGGVRLPFWGLVELTDSAARLRAPDDPSERDAVLGHGLDDVLAFALDRGGRVRLRSIRIGTASPQLNQALIGALLAADSARAFPPPSDSLRRTGGTIRLRIVDAERYRGPAVPLFRLGIPVIPVITQPVEVVRFTPPRYPEVERSRGISGEVEVLFVVKEDGTVDRETVHLLQGFSRGVAEATLTALSRARFKPAQAGECAVPSLVRQRISFEIRR